MPAETVVSRGGMVAAAHWEAAEAGVTMLENGGTAADAAVATGMVMAVTGPHLCGLGGDMLAVVSPPPNPDGTTNAPVALLGVGRAGSGANPDFLRAEGRTTMPLRNDLESVTIPGAVDGWLELHQRYGRLPLADVLWPARAMAKDGFEATGLLAMASTLVVDVPDQTLCPGRPLEPGELVRLPQVAGILRDIIDYGRDGFYGGRFGRALTQMGGGLYTEDDLAQSQADWFEPVTQYAWGHGFHTVPAPSQGYLTLAGAAVAEMVGLPEDTDDPLWAHLLVEAARAVGHDRPACLHDRADTQALLSAERLERAAERIDRNRAAPPDVEAGPTTPPVRALSPDGDTTHLCAVDANGMGVSLTQSNALDFGSHLVVPGTSIFLHNRGLGFSLEPGHPAELAPGRRPPHTLSPAVITRTDGSLAVVFGAMGGDAQPQILLQLAARTLRSGTAPGDAVSAPRFALDAPKAGPFRLWWGSDLEVRLEADAPEAWFEGLAQRGHRVVPISAQDPVSVGCSQLIAVNHDVRGGSDPRSEAAAAVGTSEP
jgi:gamma-glutamyltranspeptidase/glutathione hydrolase